MDTSKWLGALGTATKSHWVDCGFNGKTLGEGSGKKAHRNGNQRGLHDF